TRFRPAGAAIAASEADGPLSHENNVAACRTGPLRNFLLIFVDLRRALVRGADQVFDFIYAFPLSIRESPNKLQVKKLSALEESLDLNRRKWPENSPVPLYFPSPHVFLLQVASPAEYIT